jgi:hypothetical protein
MPCQASLAWSFDKLAATGSGRRHRRSDPEVRSPPSYPLNNRQKFKLVINLKPAKALGLTIPQSLLLRADEVIQ